MLSQGSVLTLLAFQIPQMQGNGQAVVYNTSVVTANPTSIAQSAPKMLMHAATNAWAKVGDAVAAVLKIRTSPHSMACQQ